MENYKSLVFSGNCEDFSTWSTRMLAYMQTKSLFKAVMGTDVTVQEPGPVPSATTERATWEAAKKTYDDAMAAAKENRNQVWCILALPLDESSLLYIKHDCVGSDGYGDGGKAWQMLNQRYRSIEKPSIVSIMGQLGKLRLSSDESLDDYCIRAQSLYSRLTDAGEQLSGTLFNAMVLNGLSEQYEAFVIQESFNPSGSFAALRLRMRAFADSKVQRSIDTDNRVALNSRQTISADRKQNLRCNCCNEKGHFRHECEQRETAACDHCGRRGHLIDACRKRRAEYQSSNYVVASMMTFSGSSESIANHNHIVVDSGATDHIMKDRSKFTCYKSIAGKTVTGPNGKATKYGTPTSQI